MNISNSNLSFKSIVIKDGGIGFITENDGENAVSRLSETELKYKNYNWNLIVNKEGYSLYSPYTRKLYSGEFYVRKHRRFNKDNTVKEQIVIRTGDKNKSKFIIDYPSREEVSSVYKKFKKSTGLSKMLVLLEALEQQLLDSSFKKKVKSVIKLTV